MGSSAVIKGLTTNPAKADPGTRSHRRASEMLQGLSLCLIVCCTIWRFNLRRTLSGLCVGCAMGEGGAESRLTDYDVLPHSFGD